jgi:hypothetical protein
MKRITIPLLILFTSLTAVTAWAGSRIVYVPPPNGTDDTTNIQAALDTCVAYGKNCTVQLAAGVYLTRQLVAYNFQGTFKGMGKDITVIQALPYLPVTLDFLAPCLPNSTTCLWPTLMIFVDGNISISDLAVHMYASEGTATAPWPRFGSTYIDTGIRLMGQYSTTNVQIDRVEMEGSPDSTSGFGFNVNNGIMYTGELSGSSANPTEVPCGAAGGFYFVSGSYTVRNSSFKTMGDGVSQDGCVRSSQVTIGGSPSTGNTFENHNTGIDLESAENSNFEVSYNVASGIGYSMWVVPWFDSVFVPSKPSRYLIHDNTFFTTQPYATGILLYNDTPDNLWIDAVIWNNNIQLQDSASDGIDAVNTKGTMILKDTVTGSGWDAIGLYGSTSSGLMSNNVSGFAPDPSTGSTAQIYLDPSTTHDLVVCAERSDTVLNQGTNNTIIGCQDPRTTPAVATDSVAPAVSAPKPNLPKGKPRLF